MDEIYLIQDDVTHNMKSFMNQVLATLEQLPTYYLSPRYLNLIPRPFYIELKLWILDNATY